MPFKIDPKKLRLCLQNPKFEAYSRSIGERIREAAITAFEVAQKHTNDHRLSNWSPPKYAASFRVEFYRATLTTRVSNDDPGWGAIEFGYMPGGGENGEDFVPAMKPLRKGLLTVAII